MKKDPYAKQRKKAARKKMVAYLKKKRAKKKKLHAKMKNEKRLDKLIRKYGKDILKNRHFIESENHIQHGTVSVRRHCIDVAKNSLRLSKLLGIPCDKKDLVRGALLHDFFQYDWHSEEHCGIQNLHGFYHPGIALRNAEKEYELTKTQRDIIKKHMWPLTVIPPVSREGWIVSLADKYCSLLETLHIHK